MEYTALIFPSQQDAYGFNTAPIDSFLWEKDGYSRPESYAAMFGIEGEGIYALLWSFEDNIRCECTKRDDPVYTDSCLELFLMPVEGDKRYVNFEMNKNGVYLSQIGETREERRFIKELTALEPVITPFEVEESGKTAWGCEIFLPEKFISELYQTDFSVCECTVKGNFYKCGDLTDAPHYGAHFPVKTDKPDFHRPEFFGDIIFRKA